MIPTVEKNLLSLWVLCFILGVGLWFLSPGTVFYLLAFGICVGGVLGFGTSYFIVHRGVFTIKDRLEAKEKRA
jgi:ethanolamine transporter EutH